MLTRGGGGWILNGMASSVFLISHKKAAFSMHFLTGYFLNKYVSTMYTGLYLHNLTF